MDKKQSAGRHEFNLFKKARSPYYYVRIMHGGRRRKFSTGETTVRNARNKAAAIIAGSTLLVNTRVFPSLRGYIIT